MFGNDEIPNFCLDLGLEETQERPPAKKQRFQTLKDAELDQLLDGATAKSTKYATTYAVTVFKGEKQFFYFVNTKVHE